ncbi:MAG: thioredoxin fold domain-containing protein [Cellvibrionaceae bacterium]|nr:thioredoxin fold domain-containing protein [Cellvibrionaceae bacterium]
MLRALFAIALLLCLPWAQAQGNDQSNYAAAPLHSLQQASPADLAAYQGSWVMAVLIEPDCRWCVLQMRDLAKLQQACPQVQPVAVALRGKRMQLLKEMRRAKADIPAARASQQFKQQLGNIETTPWLLVLDPNGKEVARLRGYTPLDQLRSALSC